MSIALASSLAAAATLTVADVGDPESFGRSVKYLGLLQIPVVDLEADCTDAGPPDEVRCVTLNPQPAATTFSDPDMAHMNLPAKATNTLLCFQITPFNTYALFNHTATDQNGTLRGTALIRIDNSLLNDPALINPATGEPFGGQITTSLATDFDIVTLAPNHGTVHRGGSTRGCIAGLISQRVLVEAYGLTQAQAIDFFKRPMTVTFGASVSGQLVETGQWFYGLRLYGD